MIMRRNPAYDTDNPPGQYIPKRLGEIIDRVQRQERADRKKLSFEEWWRGPREVPQTEEAAREAWDAGQRNV